MSWLLTRRDRRRPSARPRLPDAHRLGFRGQRKEAGRVPGQVVPDFTLPDARTGQLHRLSDDECEATVIVFCGTQWHPARTYIPRLEKYSIAGENRGVQFLLINSDAGESIDDVAKQARELGAAFPVLKDDDNRVADLLAAERVGEAFVIDQDGRVRYRGAIDDQFDSDPPRDKPSAQLRSRCDRRRARRSTGRRRNRRPSRDHRSNESPPRVSRRFCSLDDEQPHDEPRDHLAVDGLTSGHEGKADIIFTLRSAYDRVPKIGEAGWKSRRPVAPVPRTPCSRRSPERARLRFPTNDCRVPVEQRWLRRCFS